MSSNLSRFKRSDSGAVDFSPVLGLVPHRNLPDGFATTRPGKKTLTRNRNELKLRHKLDKEVCNLSRIRDKFGINRNERMNVLFHRLTL